MQSCNDNDTEPKSDEKPKRSKVNKKQRCSDCQQYICIY